MNDRITTDEPLSPVDRIVESWEAVDQRPPDLRAVLASYGTLPARDLADCLLIDQQFRWQAGHGTLVETYLNDWPEIAADQELRSDLVYGEFRVRAALSSPPDWDAFVERFSDLRDTLERQAEVSRWFSETPSGETWSVDLSQSDVTTRAQDQAVADTQISSSPQTDVIDNLDPRAPLVFSDFELQKLLGSGGMGQVFEAIQLSLNKPVALKFLTNMSAGSRSVDRFLHEARTVAALRHPRIVDVHGIGRCDDGRYFLVMDLLPGDSLADRIECGLPGIAEAVETTIQVAGAIAHANSRGVIHRDLKPSNVLLDSDGQAIVADFGLARSEYSGLSSSGDILGTPQYMAPEQADERYGPITPATDVYGLGAVFYSLLTGQPPFRAGSAAQVITKVISADPPANPSTFRDDLPASLEAICLKCLRKMPAERYGSAQEFVAALQTWRQESEPGSSQPERSAEPVVPANQRTSPWRRWPARLALGAVLLAMAALLVSNRAQRGPQSQRLEKPMDSALGGTSSNHPTPERRLNWTVDVYRRGRQDDRVRLTDYPSPVLNGDQIRLQMRLPKQAYVYCFWIGSDASIDQIYPPNLASEKPVGDLALPTTEAEGMPIEGQPGTEICLVFLRDAPFSNPADILTRIKALPPLSVPHVETVLSDGIPILQTLSTEELQSRRPDLVNTLARIPETTGSRNIGPARPLVSSVISQRLAAWLERLPMNPGEMHFLAIPHAAR